MTLRDNWTSYTLGNLFRSIAFLSQCCKHWDYSNKLSFQLICPYNLRRKKIMVVLKKALRHPMTPCLNNNFWRNIDINVSSVVNGLFEQTDLKNIWCVIRMIGLTNVRSVEKDMPEGTTSRGTWHFTRSGLHVSVERRFLTQVTWKDTERLIKLCTQ